MRWLKAVVIGMGVLIVVGLTVVIITVVRRSAAPPEAPAASGRPTPPVIGAAPAPRVAGDAATLPDFGDTRILLPPGAEAVETVAQGDRLVVRLRLADGDGALLLIDARTGRKLGLIRLQRPPQR